MTTKLIVITGFLVAFAAGLMVGARQRNEPAKVAIVPQAQPISTTGPTTWPGGNRGRGGPRPPPSSIIARELDLSSEQTQKMNSIFRKVAEAGHDLDDRRRSLRQKRDNEIVELAREEENDKYETIIKNFNASNEKITEEWRDAYTSAVEQTKQILKEDQRKRYEEILARNRWDGRGSEWPWPWGQDPGGRGRGGPGGGRGGGREGGRDNDRNPRSEQRSNSSQDNRSSR